MNFKKLLLVALILGSGVSVYGQEFEIVDLVEKPQDQSAQIHPRKDRNGIPCALVRVLLNEPGAKFEGNFVVGDAESFTGGYNVYLASGGKKFTIKHDKALPIEVSVSNFGIKNFVSNKTYEMSVVVSAQTFRVERFVPKVSDVSARTRLRLDDAGKECALIKVLLTQKGAVFPNAVGEVENKTNEYYVYLSPGTQKLTVIIGQNSLDVVFADYEVDCLEAKTTYEMVITSASRKKSSNHTSVPSDFIASAENGDAEAECNLGKCHYLGQGTPQNYYVALTWFRKSAEKNWAEAQYYIGRCYSYGQGVPKPDFAQAFSWYEKAAEQGYADAQYQLGLCYEKGQGVTKDTKAARKWYEKAAANGNTKALLKIR